MKNNRKHNNINIKVKSNKSNENRAFDNNLVSEMRTVRLSNNHSPHKHFDQSDNLSNLASANHPRSRK